MGVGFRGVLGARGRISPRGDAASCMARLRHRGQGFIFESAVGAGSCFLTFPKNSALP